MKRNLPWILLGLSLVFNAVFVGGFLHARLGGHGIQQMAGGPDMWREAEDGARGEELRTRAERRIGWMVRRLDLTADQERQLRSILESFRTSGRELRDQLAPYRAAIVNEILSDTPDLAAIEENLSALDGARSVTARTIVSELLAFRNSLSPEQRAKLAEIVARRQRDGGFSRF